MKKLLFLIITVLLINPAFTKEQDVITGEVNFYWSDISQEQRDEKIIDVRTSLFQNKIIEEYKNQSLKDKFKDKLKDPDRDWHILLVKNGQLEQKDRVLAGFYAFRKMFIMYAVTYFKEPNNAYYYDLMGNLIFVDYSTEPYPKYPTEIYQFKISDGKMVSAVYSPAKDEQYMYDSKKRFLGVWYKDKMYNKQGKSFLKRKI